MQIILNETLSRTFALEHTMKKINRGLSRLGLLSLGIVASLILAVPLAHAQVAKPDSGEADSVVSGTAALTTTTSTASFKVGGNATAARTGLGETVTFSGEVVITANVVTDPVLPTGVAVYIDGRGVTGVGSRTGTVYRNSCEANLTRLFGPTDKIDLTFAFFEDKSGSYLTSKTGLITITLTYDEATRKLTAASGSVGTL